MDSNPTDLAIVAGLAGAAFAVMNGLVGLLKESLRKRNGRSNGTPFTSADRLHLEQTHKGVQESFSQRRRISDAIADGFREMSGTLDESLTEDRKQTQILESLVKAFDDERQARRVS
ncbi:MAG: hypothetical protein V3T08_09555 [Gemmatimonadota bacterium]